MLSRTFLTLFPTRFSRHTSSFLLLLMRFRYPHLLVGSFARFCGGRFVFLLPSSISRGHCGNLKKIGNHKKTRVGKGPKRVFLGTFAAFLDFSYTGLGRSMLRGLKGTGIYLVWQCILNRVGLCSVLWEWMGEDAYGRKDASV